MTVTQPNPYFDIGTELRPTGRENAADQVEVVRIGHFPERSYQQTPEGQLIWVQRDVLDQITGDG